MPQEYVQLTKPSHLTKILLLHYYPPRGGGLYHKFPLDTTTPGKSALPTLSLTFYH